MIDKNCLGASTEDRFVVVDLSQVRLFAQAISDSRFCYTDEDILADIAERKLPVPPTFMQTLSNLSPPGQDVIIDIAGAPLDRLLHASQEFDYHHPIYVRDIISIKDTITDIKEKKDGALIFLTKQSTYHNQNNIHCGTSRSTVLVRV